MAKRRKKSKPPRPDKMPGPIKYKKPTGDKELSLLEIATGRAEKPKARKRKRR